MLKSELTSIIHHFSFFEICSFRKEIVNLAKIYGLELAESINLDEETGNPYYFCFSHSPLFLWLIRLVLLAIPFC